MTIDLISFDLDGTLIDTASEIAEAANRALESYGLERRHSDHGGQPRPRVPIASRDGRVRRLTAR